MAYDEGTAQRIRDALAGEADFSERKMFGGLCFMVDGHMCCGVTDGLLMARVGAEQYETALERPHARKMDFTGKPMTGFVYVDPPGFEHDDDLQIWIDLCRSFNATLPPK